MGLIKKVTELELPSTVKMMVYGSAGAGKSTLALSAPKPLLLDFDNGVKRINKAHLEGVDIVQVGSWRDMYDLVKENLSEYKTIVVDTIGKMMDFIIAYKCGVKQPTIRDWGGINQEFSWFTRTLSSLNKNVIFVAHRDSRKEGDDTIFVPSLREKSYSAIVTELDLLGYVEMRNNGGIQTRTITFDPTSRNEGKNTCGLPAVMNIPVIINGQNIVGENNFVTKSIIEPYMTMLAQKQEEIKAYNNAVVALKAIVDGIVDADSANEATQKIKDFNHVGSSIEKARVLLKGKIAELGLTYNKETKLYA